MKGISRRKSRMAIISMILFVAFLSLGYITFNGYLMIGSLLFLVIWLILFLTTNRCPYCGEHFRGFRWSEPSAGYCRKCGKLMEYDDAIR